MRNYGKKKNYCLIAALASLVAFSTMAASVMSGCGENSDEQKTTKKEQIITINEEGKLIRKAFLWKANNKLSNEEIRHRLAAEGFHICKQKLSELFKNTFYCGYMAHKFLQGDNCTRKSSSIDTKRNFLESKWRVIQKP